VATRDKQQPFLAFKLFQDRIVVDSNEDGFLESNVRAICSVADSTKSNVGGYIGEKGIGFKAVFKVARKVHIQSEPFHFSFDYTQDEDDDDGLGMITPHPEPPTSLPPEVRTRMTLTLLDTVSYEQMKADLQALSETLLLFLWKLQVLKIEFYPEGDAASIRTVTHSKSETEDTGTYTTYLRKRVSESHLSEVHLDPIIERKYYIFKRSLSNLPPDKARRDKRGNYVQSAPAVLAFPVGPDDTPELHQQHTFAFLPLRRVGFTFILHSDFVTQANREDVVHSERNKAILVGFAGLFRDAMLRFRENPTLQWQWMRYLPSDNLSDEFWKELWPLIRKTLEQTPLLYARDKPGRYIPPQLHIVPEKLLDQSGSPLLADLQKPIYLSGKYAIEDHDALRRLGTRGIAPNAFLELLNADLQRTDGSSRWKSLDSSSDWRTRLCKVIIETFNKGPFQQTLREMRLTPTTGGKWGSTAAQPEFYFPTTQGVPLPGDLGLLLVHKSAIANNAWKELISKLGVAECTPHQVINSINRVESDWQNRNTNLQNHIAHARCLFHFLPQGSTTQDFKINLVTQEQYLSDSRKECLYFSDIRDEFSPAELFRKTDEAPGYQADYLHEDYLKAVESTVTVHGRKWLQWLEELAGVRWTPPLTQGGHDRLSTEFGYLIQHRLDRLLGTVKRYWISYEPQMTSAIVTEIRASEVSLKNGTKSQLDKSFLQFPKLVQAATRYGIEKTFPFIPADNQLTDEERVNWTFLNQFGIGIKDDLKFYIRALRLFKGECPSLSTPTVDERLLEMYDRIQSKGKNEVKRVKCVLGPQKYNLHG
jgi:hypothetical protein